jgi:hypothetical protein
MDYIKDVNDKTCSYNFETEHYSLTEIMKDVIDSSPEEQPPEQEITGSILLGAKLKESWHRCIDPTDA